MSSARYAVLSSGPAADIEAARVPSCISSRSACVLGLSCTAVSVLAILLVRGLQHSDLHGSSGTLSSSTAHELATIAAHLPSKFRGWFRQAHLSIPAGVDARTVVLAVSALVLVATLTVGHMILGMLLRCFIVRGTRRVLVGIEVLIGKLRLSPCGGRLYLKDARVCQPKHLNTSKDALSRWQEKYMLEANKLICHLNTCKLIRSWVCSKVKRTELVLEIEQFLLQNMVINFEQHFSGESNWKLVIDQIQGAQTKCGAPNKKTSGSLQKSTAKKKKKVIIHRLDVSGLKLQLQASGAGVNSDVRLPHVVLPDIRYYDFFAQTKKSDDTEIALELATRILKLVAEAAAKQTASIPISVGAAIMKETGRMGEAVMQAASAKTIANAAKKTSDTLTQQGKVISEQAAAQKLLQSGVPATAAALEILTAKATTKFAVTSRQLAAGAKSSMSHMVQKAGTSVDLRSTEACSSQGSAAPVSAGQPRAVQVSMGSNKDSARLNRERWQFLLGDECRIDVQQEFQDSRRLNDARWQFLLGRSSSVDLPQHWLGCKPTEQDSARKAFSDSELKFRDPRFDPFKLGGNSFAGDSNTSGGKSFMQQEFQDFDWSRWPQQWPGSNPSGEASARRVLSERQQVAA